MGRHSYKLNKAQAWPFAQHYHFVVFQSNIQLIQNILWERICWNKSKEEKPNRLPKWTYCNRQNIYILLSILFRFLLARSQGLYSYIHFKLKYYLNSKMHRHSLNLFDVLPRSIILQILVPKLTKWLTQDANFCVSVLICLLYLMYTCHVT